MKDSMAAANDGAPSANNTPPAPTPFTSRTLAPAIGFLRSRLLKKFLQQIAGRD